MANVTATPAPKPAPKPVPKSDSVINLSEIWKKQRKTINRPSLGKRY